MVPILLALALSYMGIALAFAHDTAPQQESIVLGSSLIFGIALAYVFLNEPISMM